MKDVLALITIFGIILFGCVMLYPSVRPKCYVCGKSDWFWKFQHDVVFGSGPETCETAARCKTCKL